MKNNKSLLEMFLKSNLLFKSTDNKIKLKYFFQRRII